MVLIIVSFFTTGSPIERDYNSEPEKVNTLGNNNNDGKHVINNNYHWLRWILDYQI